MAKGKFNPEYFHQSDDPIQHTAGKGVVSQRDWIATQDYLGLYPTLTDDRRVVLAKSQTWYNKLGNAYSQFKQGFVPEVLAQASAMIDLPTYSNVGKAWFADDVRRWADRKIAVSKANNPIFYRTDDPLVNHPLNDVGFWMENGADLARSAGAFVASGFGAAKLLKLPKILGSVKAIEGFVKAYPAARTALAMGETALHSYAMTHSEGFGVAVGVYDQSYKKYLQDNPDDVQGANSYAASRAQVAYDLNRINFLLNLSSSFMFLKPGYLAGTRNVIDKPGLLNSLKRMGVEGLQEYAEENVNLMAEHKGLHEGYSIADGIRDAISAEGVSAGILGFIGGVAQTGGTIGVQNVTQGYKNYRDGKGFVTDRRLAYEHQQEILKEFGEITKGGKIKDLTTFYNSTAELTKLMEDAQAAYDRGDEAEYEAISRKLVSEQAFKAFESGTTDKLIDLYNEIGNLSEEKLIAEGFEKSQIPDIRARAAKAVNTITRLEKAYATSRMYKNGRDVYVNRANDVLLNDYLEQVKTESTALVPEVTRLVQSAVEAGVLSDTLPDGSKLEVNLADLTSTKYDRGTPEYEADIDFTEKASNTIPEVARLQAIHNKIKVLKKALNNNNKAYFDLTSNKTQREIQRQLDFHREVEKLRDVEQDAEYAERLDALKKKYESKLTTPIIDAIIQASDEARRNYLKAGKKSLRKRVTDALRRKHATDSTASTTQQRNAAQQPAAQPAANNRTTSAPSPTQAPPAQPQPTQQPPPPAYNPPAPQPSAGASAVQDSADTASEELADAWSDFVSSVEATTPSSDELFAPPMTDNDYTTQQLAFFSKAIDVLAKQLGREPNFSEVVESFVNSVGIEPFKRHNKTLALLYVARLNGRVPERLSEIERIIDETRERITEESYERVGVEEEFDEEAPPIKTLDEILEFDNSGNVRIVNDAVVTAFNKVAYLSVDYDKIVVKTDKLEEVSRLDIQDPRDNPIVVNTETPGAVNFLLTPKGWEKKVIIRKVADPSDILVTADHQAETIEKVKFGDLNLTPGTDEYNSRVPIEIIDAETGDVVGYLHETRWIDTHNVAESAIDTIADQRRALLGLREAILASESGIETTVRKTTIGKSGRLNKSVPLNIANPDPDTKLVVIGANGELRDGRNNIIPHDDILGGKEYVNRITVDALGRVFELRPIPHDGIGPKHALLSVGYTNVSEEAAYSVVKAIEAYLMPNVPENARLIQEIKTQTRIDISSAEGVERYINFFVKTQAALSGGDYKQVYVSAKAQADRSGTRIDDGTGISRSIPASLPFIGVQHGSVVFGQVNTFTPNGEPFAHFHPKALENATREDIENLKANLSFLSEALRAKSFNYDLAHADMNPLVPVIQPNGTISSDKRYVDHVKSRMTTNIPSYAVPIGEGKFKYVTFVQPIVRVITPEVAAEEKEKQESANNAANVTEATTLSTANDTLIEDDDHISQEPEDVDLKLKELEDLYGDDDIFDTDALAARDMAEQEVNAINEYLSSRRIGGLSTMQQAHVVDYLFNLMAEAVMEARSTEKGKVWRHRTGRVNFDAIIEEATKTFSGVLENKLAGAKAELRSASAKVAQGKSEYGKVVSKLNQIIPALETLQQPENVAKLFSISVSKLGLYMDIKLKYDRKNGTVEEFVLGRLNELEKGTQDEGYPIPADKQEIPAVEQDADPDNTEDFQTEEQTNERVYSKSSLEMDQKATITTRFRRFMSGIKLQKADEVTGKLEDVKGFMGLPVYVPFDVAYNTVSGIMARSKVTPDLASMIAALREKSEAIPWLSSLADRLESDQLDAQVKNEFVVSMAKHAAFMKFAMYSKTKKGMVLRLYDSDANTTERVIYSDWITNFKASPLVVADRTDEYIIDKEAAKAAMSVYERISGVNFKPPKSLNERLASNVRKVLESGPSKEVAHSTAFDTATLQSLNEALKDGPASIVVDSLLMVISKEGDSFTVKRFQQPTVNPADVAEFLQYFGINVTPSTLRDIVAGRMEHRGKLVTLRGQLQISDNTSGVLGALAFKLQRVISADEPINATQENPLEQGVVSSLAALEAKYTDRSMPNSIRTGDKVIYPYTQSKFSTDRIEDLQEGRFNVLGQLLNTPFASASSWLNMMASDDPSGVEGMTFGQLFRQMMGISHLDINALKEHGKRVYRNASIDSLPDADHELVKIVGIQDSRQGADLTWRGHKYRWASFFMPTMSDKGSMLLLKVLARKIDSSSFVKAEDGTLSISTDLLNHIFEQTVLPELLRMNHFYREVKSTDIEGYDLGAKMFNMFPALNAATVTKDGETVDVLTLMKEASTSLDLDTILTQWPELKTALMSKVNEIVVKKINEKVDKWKSLGIITKNEKDVQIMPFFDSAYMSRFGQQSSDDLAFMVAADHVISYMNANANTFMAVIGDPAMFTKTDSEGFDFSSKFADEAKRATLTAEDYIRAANNTFINIGKRLASMIAPGNKMANSTDKTYRSLQMKDRVSMSKEIAYLSKLLDGKEFDHDAYIQMTSAEKKAYVKSFPRSMAYMKIKGTDGQEYTTWQEHLTILEGMAKTPGYAFDISLKEIAQVRDMVSRGIQLKDMSPRQLAVFKKVFQPLKPVYTGQHYDDRAKAMRFIYVKTSSIPLLPQVVAGTELEKLERYMQDNKIDRAVYGTGVKAGFTTNPLSIWTDEGRIVMPDKHDESHVMQMDRRNFRIQQDKPYKGEKEHINLGTQESKLLFGDILDVDTFSFEGKQYTGLELYNEYNEMFRKLFDIRLNKFYNRLGLVRETNGVLVPKDADKTMQELQKILIEEAEARNYSASDIEGLEIGTDGKFIMPIWTHVNASRYEALLVSIVNNKLVKTKMPGFSMVVGSEEGFISELPSEESQELKVSETSSLGNTFTRPFRVVIDKDGKLSKYDNVPTDSNLRIVEFFSVEHAYQVLKSGEFDDATHERYLNWATSHGMKVDGKIIPGTLPAKVDAAKDLMAYLVNQSFIQTPKGQATADLINSGRSAISYDVKGDGRNDYMAELLSNARQVVQSRAERAKRKEAFEKYQSRIIWTSKWEGSLRGYRPDGKGGMLPQQVLMPSRLKDAEGKVIDLTAVDSQGNYIYIQPVGDRLFLKEEMFDAEALKLFGFRIPTSKQLSMHSTEVVGFLPPEAGDLVIESRDLVVQTGQDFDIDMKYFYQYNLEVDTSGKVSVLKERAATADETEEQRKTRLEDNAKKEQRLIENRIIAIHHAVMLNGDARVQKHIASPLSMDVAREQAERIEFHTTKTDTSFTPLSDEYQKDKLISASHGKTGTGAYSLDVVFHASTQILAAKGTPIEIYAPNVVEGERGPYRKWVPVEMRMGSYTADGQLGRSTTLDGKRTISEALSERQNLSVDNEKEQIMGRINLNRTTMDADKAMTLLGFDLDTYTDQNTEVVVSLRDNLLAQPIVKRFVQLMSNAESSISDYGDNKMAMVIDQLVSEFGGDFKFAALQHYRNYGTSPTESNDLALQDTMHSELDRIGRSLTGKNLLDSIKGQFSGDKNTFQQGVLMQFLMFHEIGLQIRDVQTTVNADSKGLGKSMVHVIARAERILELADKKNPFAYVRNAEKLIGDFKYPESDNEKDELVSKGYIPILNVYIRPDSIQGYAAVFGIDTVFQAFMNQDIHQLNMFPYLDPEYRAVVGEVIGYTGAGFKGQVSTHKRALLYETVTKEARKYINGIVAYNNNGMNPITNTKIGISSERERLFMDRAGNPSLATYLRSLPASIRNTNAFLRLLSFDINTDGRSPSLIKVNSATGSNFDEQHIYDAFYGLLANARQLPEFQGESYDTRKLAQDLISYALLEGGVQEAVQFSKYIPMMYMKESGIADFLKLPFSYFQMFKYDSERNLPSEYALQFFQHNPSQAMRYVEPAKDKPLLPVYMFPETRKGLVGYRLNPKIKDMPNDLDPYGTGEFPMFISTYESGEGFKLYMRKGSMYQGGEYVQIPTLGTQGPGMSEYNPATNYLKHGKFNTSMVAQNNPPRVAAAPVAPVKTEQQPELQPRHRNIVPEGLPFSDLTDQDKASIKLILKSLRDEGRGAIADALESNNVVKSDLQEVVKYMTEKYGTPYADFLIKNLATMLKSGNVFFYHANDVRPAFYSRTTNAIYINTAMFNNAESAKYTAVLAHEMIHQLTAKELDKYIDGNDNLKVPADMVPQSVMNLYTLYKEAKARLWVNSPSTERAKEINYALSNIHEFTTGALTSFDFIQAMSNIPTEGDNSRSLLDRFITIISDIVSGVLNLAGIDVRNTMAENAISYAYQLLLDLNSGAVQNQVTKKPEQQKKEAQRLLNVNDKALAAGSVVNINGNTYTIFDIDHANRTDVKAIFGNAVVKLDYDSVVKATFSVSNIVGRFPLVAYNNQQFIVDGNDVYSTISGKKVNYAGVELERILKLAEDSTKALPRKSQYSSKYKDVQPATRMLMRYKDGENNRFMRPEFSGKSTLELIMEGKRTATSRRDIPVVFDERMMTNRPLKAGDVVEFFDDDGNAALVRITTDPYPVSQISRDDWSKLEGWMPDLYDDILKRTIPHRQIRFTLLDYKTSNSVPLTDPVITTTQTSEEPGKFDPKEGASEEVQHSFTFRNGVTVPTDFELTAQQKEALQLMADFLSTSRNGMDNVGFSLRGFAGTGKTSIVKYLVNYISETYKPSRGTGWLAIEFATPTHKAAKVLGTALRTEEQKRSGKKKKALTLAKLLKKTKRGIGENAQWITTGDDIPGSGLLIIDEASMMDTAQINEILKLADEKGTKVIFMGDPAQIPSPGGGRVQQLSTALYQKNAYELTEVKRQGNDNPLFDIFNAIRNNINSPKDVFSPVTALNNKGEGVEFIKDVQTFRNRVIEMFERYKDNPSEVKLTAYTNSAVMQWNQYIRSRTLQDRGLTPYQVGEVLMGYDQMGTTDVENGQDYIITKRDYTSNIRITNILTGEKINASVFRLQIKEADELGTADPVNISILDILNPENQAILDYIYQLTEEYNKYHASYNRKRDIQDALGMIYTAFQVPSNLISYGGKVVSEEQLMKEKPDLFRRDQQSGMAPIDMLQSQGKAVKFKKTIDYGYAITVHKVQGSTYEHIMIDMDSIDIPATRRSVVKPDGTTYGVENNMLKYVAFSRPRKSAVVFTTKAIEKPVPQKQEAIPATGTPEIIIRNDELFYPVRGMEPDMPLSNIASVTPVQVEGLQFQLPATVIQYKKSLSPDKRAIFERLVREKRIKPKCE